MNTRASFCRRYFPLLAAIGLVFLSMIRGTAALAASRPSFSATASGMVDNQTLIAHLTVADADLGGNGKVYMAAVYGTLLFAHNGAGWQRWEGGALPAYFSGFLASQNITVVSGADLTPLAGLHLYVGYGLTEADMLANGKFGLVHTVSGEMVTPYVDAADMASIVQVFNAMGEIVMPDGSTGSIHDGLDIVPAVDLAAFQAVCAGRVDSVLEAGEDVVVFLSCDSSHMAEYVFEPQSSTGEAGPSQLANMEVIAGQTVSQGEVIGRLFRASGDAHVHFAVHRDWVPHCPAPYFTEAAADSILGLVRGRFPGGAACYGADATPAPLVTPYVAEADMASVNESFSTAGVSSPWGFTHNGIDFSPQGNLRPFQAVCSGTVDSLTLCQNDVTANWQVNLTVACDQYVSNPGGYFPPFTIVYGFEPMSASQADGQTQLANIAVSQGQAVAQGDVLGNLLVVGAGAHVHFGVMAYGGSAWSEIGSPSIAFCPEQHFSSGARDSILRLLRVVWADADFCYQ
ncbi:MAG: hypothetical protein ACOY3Z_09435 [Thermodesulfobacteriota bacterium]